MNILCVIPVRGGSKGVPRKNVRSVAGRPLVVWTIEQALAALQAKIGHGTDIDDWLADRGLANARRLWQVLDIEPGWEDALEAVLRERLSALELDRLDTVTDWVAGGAQPPRRRRRGRDHRREGFDGPWGRGCWARAAGAVHSRPTRCPDSSRPRSTGRS